MNTDHHIRQDLVRTLARLVLLLAMIFMGQPAGLAHAAGITVTTTADNTSHDGQCSLREAITNANDNAATYTDCAAGSGEDVIGFGNGLGTTTITLGSALPMIEDTAGLIIDGGDDITISGWFGWAPRSMFFVDSVFSLTLQNLTVAVSSAENGGVAENRGALTIAHSTFDQNQAWLSGGAIYNWGPLATLTISESTFSNNASYGEDYGGGGGVYNAGGTVTISDSTFSGNHGSGVMTRGGTLTITNSTFSDNTASYIGGAVLQLVGGTMTFSNSTFSGNTATDWGGAIYGVGQMNITNSTFSGNSAPNGGGVVNAGGSLSITNSTFALNSGWRGGGDVLNSAPGTLDLYNTILV
jgi:CSLREA domain-containing protein